MKSIIDILKEKESFVSFKGASKEEIHEAEEKLGIEFSQDYKEYVSQYGAASYYGHELTGVCHAESLNVVNVTVLERQFHKVPGDWYVIEQTHIDDIVFWQDSEGKIYKTQDNKKPQMVYRSLTEYIMS